MIFKIFVIKIFYGNIVDLISPINSKKKNENISIDFIIRYFLDIHGQHKICIGNEFIYSSINSKKEKKEMKWSF